VARLAGGDLRLPVPVAIGAPAASGFSARRVLVEPVVPLALCWLGLAVAATAGSAPGVCLVLAVAAGYSLSGST
jgi:hypothetical protein